MLGVHAVMENAVYRLLAIRRRPGRECCVKGDENAEARDQLHHGTTFIL
jgi:hypothetical protein